MADNSNFSGFGVGAFATGHGILLQFPNAAGNVAAYNSYLMGTTDVAIAYRNAVSESGMTLSRMGTTAPMLGAGQYGFSSNFTHNAGNSATAAEAARLQAQYGSRIGEITMDLQGKGFARGTYTIGDGKTFHPDLQYQTRSWLSGATDHFDEVKARGSLSGSHGNLSEIGNYGRAISETNATNGFYRNLGYAAKGAGALGLGYDAFQTAGAIHGEVKAGDYSGAALSGAEFGGRWGAGLYLGSLGATWGSTFGPWVSLGLGIGGGLTGAIGGQRAVEKVANALGISHSSQLSTFGTDAPGSWSSQPGQNWSASDFNATHTNVPGTTIGPGGNDAGSTNIPARPNIQGDLKHWNAIKQDVAKVQAANAQVTENLKVQSSITAASAAHSSSGNSNNSNNSHGSGYSGYQGPSGSGFPDRNDPNYGGPPNTYYGDGGSSSGSGGGGSGSRGDVYLDNTNYNYGSGDYNIDYDADRYFDQPINYYNGSDAIGPVVLDLTGNGIKITQLSSSNIFFDAAGDGYQHRTSWAGAGNGVLVLDIAGNGQITERNQASSVGLGHL